MPRFTPSFIFPIVLALAACGEGSSNTPTTPTTTSPASTNDALSNLRVDQSFPNTAVVFTFDSSVATATNGSLAVAYSAANQSYTLTDGSRTQSFAPADRLTDQSQVGLNVFQRVNGNIIDRLSLLRSGSTTVYPTQYAGAGIWERRSNSGAAATIEPFFYGVAATQSAGQAYTSRRYSLDFLHAAAVTLADGTQSATTLGGEGYIDVDFSKNTFKVIFSRHPLGQLNNLAPFRERYAGSGTVASDGTLSGTADCTCGGAPLQISGKFFGPQSEEIGVAYRPQNNSIGDAGAGVGRLRTTDEILDNANFDVSFDLAAVGVSYTYTTNAAGFVTAASFGEGPIGFYWSQPISRLLLVRSFTPSTQYGFTEAMRVPPTDSLTYRFTDTLAGNPTTVTLSRSSWGGEKATGGNLVYSGSATVARQSGSGDPQTVNRDMLVFGYQAPDTSQGGSGSDSYIPDNMHQGVALPLGGYPRALRGTIVAGSLSINRAMPTVTGTLIFNVINLPLGDHVYPITVKFTATVANDGSFTADVANTDNSGPIFTGTIVGRRFKDAVGIRYSISSCPSACTPSTQDRLLGAFKSRLSPTG